MIFKIILLSLITFTFCNFCDQNDINGLTKIYNNMNGHDWYKNNNWVSNTSCCDWYGIYCVNGRVNSINFPPNNVTGFFPNLNGTLDFLEKITITGNFIKGGLSGLIGLKSLCVIDLQNNLIYEEIPSHFLQNEKYIYLNIADNMLYGHLPTIISPYMESLFLFSNQLTGNFPWIINSSFLQIDLSDNLLVGLPDTFESTPSLELLYLKNNNISSEIPKSLSYTNITHLILDNNRFYGEIPRYFLELKSLQNFYANNNLLSSGINNLSKVKFIEVVDNKFNEIIPPDFLGYAIVFIARNNNFKGNVNIYCNMQSNIIDLTNNPNIHGKLIYYDEPWCDINIFNLPKYEIDGYECFNFMMGDCLILVDGSFLDYKFCNKTL